MKHTRIFSNFKVGSFSGTKGSMNSMFRPEYTNKEIAPLLQYLFEELQSLAYPTVRSEIFSLVNVTCPVTNYSVGYQETPLPELLLPYTGLALTFSMTPQAFTKQPKSIFTVGGADYSIYWGKSMLRTTEYVTICIPRNTLKQWDFNYALPKDLLYLYNVIGIVSKSFVQDSSWLQRNAYSNYAMRNVGVLKTQYGTLNLKRLMNTRSFNNWIHSKEIWLRASNLIHEYQFYPDFGNYFALELFDWVKDADLHFAAYDYVYGRGLHSFTSYIEKGLRDLKQFIRNDDVHTPHMEAAITLLYMLASNDAPMLNPEYWMGLRQFKNMPSCLGDTSLAARELINQTEYLSEIAEVLR